VDAIDGNGYAGADSWWHLHPRWRASKGPDAIDLTDADGRSVTIAFTTKDVEVQSGTPLAQYSPEYGRIEPSTTLRASAQGTTPFMIATCIAANAVPEQRTTIVEAHVRSQPASGWTGSALAIRAGSLDVLVLVATPATDTAAWRPRRWGTSTMQTDARVLAVARDAQRWKTIAIVGGRIVAVRTEPGAGGESSAVSPRAAVEARDREPEVGIPSSELGVGG